MPENVFPIAAYDDPSAKYTFIVLNTALLPLIEARLDEMLLESFWLTELDYERGYNAISEVIASMGLYDLQALLDSNQRIETALASILAKQIAAPSTEARQVTELLRIGDLAETAPANDTASAGINARLQRLAQHFTSLLARLPVSLGVKPAAGSLAVTLASDVYVQTLARKSLTGTLTSINASASATQLLASNVNRVNASVFNASTATLYIGLSTTVSLTSYTVPLLAGGTYELLDNYNGAVYGIWSAVNGSAKITELS